jgi:hypothetical protein
MSAALGSKAAAIPPDTGLTGWASPDGMGEAGREMWRNMTCSRNTRGCRCYNYSGDTRALLARDIRGIGYVPIEARKVLNVRGVACRSTAFP